MEARPERLVSAVIIARDEAERLARCVTACRSFADEVVVVDGGSTDDTVAIARELGCTVLENPWPGYGAQRNFGADGARHDWVFWVDADELCDTELAAAVTDWKRSNGDPPAAFSVQRVGNFMGRWLEGTRDRPIRLYDRRRCSVGVDVPVHEKVEVGEEPVGHLPGNLWHYGFRSLSDHVGRFERYATLDAQAAWERGKRFRAWRLLVRPAARLGQKLLLHGLYRKGVAGLAVGLLWVYYEIVLELKLYELEWRSSGAPHAPPARPLAVGGVADDGPAPG
jgi:glycosyltransferase involved in cell wall biosynthesis